MAIFPGIPQLGGLTSGDMFLVSDASDSGLSKKVDWDVIESQLGNPTTPGAIYGNLDADSESDTSEGVANLQDTPLVVSIASTGFYRFEAWIVEWNNLGSLPDAFVSFSFPADATGSLDSLCFISRNDFPPNNANWDDDRAFIVDNQRLEGISGAESAAAANLTGSAGESTSIWWKGFLRIPTLGSVTARHVKQVNGSNPGGSTVTMLTGSNIILEKMAEL